MRQKKVNVKGARPIQYLNRRAESGLFVRIGSSLVSPAQVKQQFGGASGLAHPVMLLMRTKVLNASSLLRLCLGVKLFSIVVFGVVVEDAMKHQAAVVADEESYGCLHLKGIKELLLATYFKSQNLLLFTLTHRGSRTGY
jgi:hypothetical protein